ncbi:MAG: hypothetical protein Q4E62_05075 [Sutterellaceae bacterium]|nr:hypothetical protein [Sutterellaceae bacterium]
MCLLSACTLPKKTETMPSEAELIAMAKNLPTEADIKERFRAVGGVLREICTSDEFAPYFAKTPCLATDVTDRQKKDRTKITEAQKKAMTAAVAEIEELNRQTRELMIESQLEPYVSLALHAQNETDVLVKTNQDNLLSGEITWGQYNTWREAIARRAMENRAAKEAVDAMTQTEMPAATATPDTKEPHP